jgi:hypothetical protein
VSWLLLIGTMPARLTTPMLGLMPTRPLTELGQRMLPSVSVPIVAAGRALQRVGVSGLPAAAAPAAAAAAAAEVGPLAQIGLAENHRAGFAQTCGDAGVLRGGLADQGDRAGRGLHRVAGVDVVLQQDWNAVQRAAHLAGSAFGIERFGDRQRIGVEFDHRIDARPGTVDALDARQIGAHQILRTHAAGSLGGGELFDAGFLDLEGPQARRAESEQQGKQCNQWAHAKPPQSATAACCATPRGTDSDERWGGQRSPCTR